jgi:phosphocarrier protein
MPAQTVEVVHPEGLHARPAAEFVKLANQFRSAVTLHLNGRQVNGRSIMSVMSLGANSGARVEVDVQGEDADEALAELIQFLGQKAGS